MKNKFYIKAELQHMAKSEILDMIPSDTLARIKTQDSHPLFKSFAVGHEGEANANIVGQGNMVLRYMKNVIVQMFERIKSGIPIFNRHGQTNDHIGRETIGEVVGKTIKTIGDKLYTIAAVYIKPAFRDQKLDVASIEANFEAVGGEQGQADVVNINQITGIALSDGDIDRPGFPGATLLGALQQFTQQGGDKKMTKEEIQKAISEGKFKLEDIFTTKEIENSEPAKRAKQTEYEHAKRVETKLGEERDARIKAEGELSTVKTQFNDQNVEINKTRIVNVLETVSNERKLDPKFKVFIKDRVKDLKSEGSDVAKVKEDINRFVDGQMKPFEEFGKSMGFEAKITTDSNNEGNKNNQNQENKGSGSGDDKTLNGDMTDPKNNDFIPDGS